VADRDPLRPAGGARGVDDVGQVVGVEPRGRRRGLGVDGRAVSVQRDDGGSGLGEPVAQGFLRHQHDGSGVLDHQGPARLGVGRIDGDVGAAGAEDGQQPHDKVQGTLDRERHQHSGPDAQAPQMGGQPARAPGELAVGHALALAGEGHGVRPLRRPLGEQAVDGAVVGVVGGRGVPVDHHLPPLVGGEEGKVPDRPVRLGHGRRQEHAEVPRQPPHRVPVEEVGVVLDRPREPPLRLGDLEGEVKLRRRALHGQQLHLQAGQPGRADGGVLEDQHHLEERRAGQVALRVQLVDQALERHILVGVGAQSDLPRLGEEPPEVGPAGEVEAHHQRVDEDADQAFDLAAVAVRDRGADGDVVLAAVAVEQGREGGQERHEEGGALAPGERAELVGGPRPDAERLAGAPEGLDRRARPVGGQLEGGGAVSQVRLPVVELLFEHRAVEPPALPDREVRVLDG
jgi:hypothetical protein